MVAFLMLGSIGSRSMIFFNTYCYLIQQDIQQLIILLLNMYCFPCTVTERHA